MKIMVLSNGSLKSLLLVALACRETPDVFLCHITKNQPTLIQERKANAAIAEYYKIPWNIIEPRLNMLPVEFVPFAFTTCLWHALVIAYQEKFDYLYYGASKDSPKEDTSLAHLAALQLLVEAIQPKYSDFGLMLPTVSVEGPLLRLRLAQVLYLGNGLQLPWELAWNCERTESLHCGQCERCKQRQRAFARVAFVDKSQYKHPLAEVR